MMPNPKPARVTHLFQKPFRKQKLTSEHSNTGVSSGAASVDILKGRKHILLVHTKLAGLLKSTGKDVEKHLTVGIGVDVAVGFVVEVVAQIMGVDKVSVLRHKSASWRDKDRN